MSALKAPLVWFGGKARVASLVWDALGDCDNYVEAFAGSLAVLLGRPDWHQGSIETVNDADKFLSNFWRALAADPDAVAYYADWPVNECDLFARHLWLVNEGRQRLAEHLEADPDWYDAQVAGWWVWGINAWIGSGWCSGEGPWHLGDAGRGVNRKLPNLKNTGMGVHRITLSQGYPGRGDSLLPVNHNLYAYFGELAARLRRVRVCCGDWSRVVTDGATAYGTTVGVFLDPPYSGDVRTRDLYASDDHEVAVAAREWALGKGDDPRFRIVLAGYEPEHAEAMAAAGWRMHAYRGWSGYQREAQANGTNGNQANRHLERLWMSPSCLDRRRQLSLLEAEA